MSLKNYIFSSVNTKGGQDSDKFATIRVKPKKKTNMASITEEGDGKIVIRTAAAPPPPPPVTNGGGPKGDGANTSFLKNMLRFWKYISVEPLILCWLLPSCFLFIAVENLALEKVCRSLQLTLSISHHHQSPVSAYSHVESISILRTKYATTWSTRAKTISIVQSSGRKCARRMWFTCIRIDHKCSTTHITSMERAFYPKRIHAIWRFCSMSPHWRRMCAMPKSRVKSWTLNWMPSRHHSIHSSAS